MKTVPLSEIPPSLRTELANQQHLEALRLAYRREQERLHWTRPNPFSGINLTYVSEVEWKAAFAGVF
jgi:hypothetical protein